MLLYLRHHLRGEPFNPAAKRVYVCIAAQAKNIIVCSGIAVSRDAVDHGLWHALTDHAANNEFWHRSTTLLGFFTQISANLREVVWTQPDRVVRIAEA